MQSRPEGAKVRVVRNSLTDCWGLTRRVVFVVAVGFVTELGTLVFSARERVSSFGKTERMVVWVEEKTV